MIDNYTFAAIFRVGFNQSFNQQAFDLKKHRMTIEFSYNNSQAQTLPMKVYYLRWQNSEIKNINSPFNLLDIFEGEEQQGCILLDINEMQVQRKN